MTTPTRPVLEIDRAATVTIRPVRASDARALSAFYAELSAESRRLRFLGACAGIGGEPSRAFCTPDHEHAEGFVAVQPDAGGPEERICGHLCLEPGEGGDVELAVAVADRLEGRGIGTALLRAALLWADDHAVSRITATTFPENRRVLRLLASAPGRMTVRPSEGGLAEVHLLLRERGARGG